MRTNSIDFSTMQMPLQQIPAVNIDILLQQFQNTFNVRDKDNLEILIDTCSVKQIPLGFMGNPLFNYWHSEGVYNLKTTERIRNEIARLPDYYSTNHIKVITDFFLGITKEGFNPVVSDENKKMIEQASEIVQQPYFNREKKTLHAAIIRHTLDYINESVIVRQNPYYAKVYHDLLAELAIGYEKLNQQITLIGIADTQMISCAVDRAREGRQTLVISDDGHIFRTMKSLRHRSKEKKIFKPNMFAFGLRYRINKLYNDLNLHDAA